MAVLNDEGEKLSAVSTHDPQSISCDGKGGVLGHPLIYLEFGNHRRVECPYCGEVFFNEPHEQNHHAK